MALEGKEHSLLLFVPLSCGWLFFFDLVDSFESWGTYACFSIWFSRNNYLVAVCCWLKDWKHMDLCIFSSIYAHTSAPFTKVEGKLIRDWEIRFIFSAVCYCRRGSHRSSRPEVICKNRILGNFAKFTGKHLCQSLFFKKVAGLQLY